MIPLHINNNSKSTHITTKYPFLMNLSSKDKPWNKILPFHIREIGTFCTPYDNINQRTPKYLYSYPERTFHKGIE